MASPCDQEWFNMIAARCAVAVAILLLFVGKKTKSLKHATNESRRKSGGFILYFVCGLTSF